MAKAELGGISRNRKRMRKERHRPHPRASRASPQHHAGDSRHLNHGRTTIRTLSGHARHGHSTLTRSIAIARR
jgi:hypothetical protein